MFKAHLKRIAAILAQTGNSSLDIYLILISESQDWVSVHPDGQLSSNSSTFFPKPNANQSILFLIIVLNRVK